MRLPAVLARRFVAGATPEAAVAVGERLAAQGIRATFDLLGEDVLNPDAARRCAEANKQLLQLIPDHVERNVSVKLTNLGLDISYDLCLELAEEVVACARKLGGFVRIDMEGSRHTQQTLDIFHALRKEHETVGIVLQAYLHRTEDDVRAAIARGDRVRLCKGAYKEPASIAMQDMADIRRSFESCARLLLTQGNDPAIATHDESLIRSTLACARESKVPAGRFEFQMLYGLRPKRWAELVAEGFRFRVYVPYGTHWFPYFYRRLRERKENVLFVLRNLLGG